MSRETKFRVANVLLALGVGIAMLVSSAWARSPEHMARRAIDGFAMNCFSPFLTGSSAAHKLSAPKLRVDFYDLDPFSSAEPTPAGGAPVTPGTDRRCEVSFDGDHALAATAGVADALRREGITKEATVPAIFQPMQGTALLAARRLNPRKIAVVHVGTRPGPNGVETFMNVERMPLAVGQD